MPGLDTRRWLICYAASIIVQSDLPVPIEELFPAYTNAAGATKTLGRRLQRAILDGMLANSYVSIRKIGGVDHYEYGSAGRHLRGIMAAEDEVADLADVFGMSEAEMRMKRYYAKEAEKRAKLSVAVRCIQKLLGQKAPSQRAALFSPKKGDKFEERAAWTPTWHAPFLDGLLKLGFVRALPTVPITYEAVDREELQKMADGRGRGPTCPYTLLWPETPCTDDHAEGNHSGVLAPPSSAALVPEGEEKDAEVEKVAQEVRDVLKLVSPEDRKQVLTEAVELLDAAPPDDLVMVKVPLEHAPAVMQMLAEHPSRAPEVLPDGAIRTETLEEAVEVSKAITDARQAELKAAAAAAPPEEIQVAVFDMLVKVMECLQSQTKSNTLILDSFQKLAETVADLRDKVEELKENVETSEDAAIQMQKKQEAAHEEFANYGNQLSQIRKRIADMEKSVSDQHGDASRLNETIRKGVAEMASQVATVAGNRPEPIGPLVEAVDRLRDEVRDAAAARAAKPRLPRSVLRKLDEAVGELTAVKDLALDAIPSKKSA